MTWVKNNFLEKMYLFFKKNKYDVIAPYENNYKNVNKYNSCWSALDFMGHPIFIQRNNERKRFYLSGACIFFKKSFYKKTGGFDNNFFMYFEEVDWFWRLNLLGKKFQYVNNLSIAHFGAGSTGSGIKYLSFLWRNQNAMQMLLKNYKWTNLLWILPLYFVQNFIEIIFFLLILQPKIAFSYIEGWIFNIQNIHQTIKKRKWIQKHRIINDLEILKKMYLGFGKLAHLINYITKQ